MRQRFGQPASKERREYFAELWNQKKPRVGAPRKKRVVEGRAQGKAPAHGASKKRARAQGASPRNSKKKVQKTDQQKEAAGGSRQPNDRILLQTERIIYNIIF